jgi:hypothetical protein
MPRRLLKQRSEAETKFREAWVARWLSRVGFTLWKNPRRDPRTSRFGRYRILDDAGRGLVTLPNLDAVEHWVSTIQTSVDIFNP